jgi:hypothetical protein
MIATGKLIFRYIYGKIMVDALVAPSVGSKPNQ